MGLAIPKRLRLLLDSHIVIWSMREPTRLTTEIASALDDIDNEKLVSAASVWETELKRASGRLRLPTDLAEMADASGFRELKVTHVHGVAAANLPRIHLDPFDRMLVAQAQIEGLTLVTADARVADYDVPLLSAR